MCDGFSDGGSFPEWVSNSLVASYHFQILKGVCVVWAINSVGGLLNQCVTYRTRWRHSPTWIHHPGLLHVALVKQPLLPTIPPWVSLLRTPPWSEAGCTKTDSWRWQINYCVPRWIISIYHHENFIPSPHDTLHRLSLNCHLAHKFSTPLCMSNLWTVMRWIKNVVFTELDIWPFWSFVKATHRQALLGTVWQIFVQPHLERSAACNWEKRLMNQLQFSVFLGTLKWFKAAFWTRVVPGPVSGRSNNPRFELICSHCKSHAWLTSLALSAVIQMVLLSLPYTLHCPPGRDAPHYSSDKPPPVAAPEQERHAQLSDSCGRPPRKSARVAERCGCLIALRPPPAELHTNQTRT